MDAKHYEVLEQYGRPHPHSPGRVEENRCMLLRQCFDNKVLLHGQ